MKYLYLNGELHNEDGVEKIVKTDTDIIGYDGNQEVFAFRGISDFSQFALAEGQNWDISENEQQEAIVAGLAYELVQKDLAIQALEHTQADTLYQLMMKGVI